MIYICMNLKYNILTLIRELFTVNTYFISVIQIYLGVYVDSSILPFATYTQYLTFDFDQSTNEFMGIWSNIFSKSNFITKNKNTLMILYPYIPYILYGPYYSLICFQRVRKIVYPSRNCKTKK